MLKKILFVILIFNLSSHCDYKPVYLNKNKVNYKITITDFTGDKYINNLIYILYAWRENTIRSLWYSK